MAEEYLATVVQDRPEGAGPQHRHSLGAKRKHGWRVHARRRPRRWLWASRVAVSVGVSCDDGLYDAAAWPLEADARAIGKLSPNCEERVESRAYQGFPALMPPAPMEASLVLSLVKRLHVLADDRPARLRALAAQALERRPHLDQAPEAALKTEPRFHSEARQVVRQPIVPYPHIACRAASLRSHSDPTAQAAAVGLREGDDHHHRP